MTADTEIPASSPTLPSKKGPGRPRSIPENPQQRIERLQAELQQAQEEFKLAEQHKAAIVGAAIVRRARADEEFRRQIAPVLRAEVKAKADLAAIADLLT